MINALDPAIELIYGKLFLGIVAGFAARDAILLGITLLIVYAIYAIISKTVGFVIYDRQNTRRLLSAIIAALPDKREEGVQVQGKRNAAFLSRDFVRFVQPAFRRLAFLSITTATSNSSRAKMALINFLEGATIAFAQPARTPSALNAAQGDQITEPFFCIIHRIIVPHRLTNVNWAAFTDVVDALVDLGLFDAA